MKTAILIGATGLVGKALLELLLKQEEYGKVVVFGRRSVDMQHLKLEEHIINFDAPKEWEALVQGDVLFSSLGTTLARAGSKAAQYKVDYTYQYAFAAAAARNGVPVYVLVSAPYVKPDALVFYSKMKGELERDVRKLPFQSFTFIQPGLLFGSREVHRTGEAIAYIVLKVFNAVGLFRGYRPVSGTTVAKAMIAAAGEAATGERTYTMEEVFTKAGE